MAFCLESNLPLPGMLALGWFFLCRVGYAWYADHRRRGTRELASVLHEYQTLINQAERQATRSDQIVAPDAIAERLAA